MIHFSLFSGIGGFELAAEWMGWKNYLSCEINDFGNKVREYYWPEAYHHKDIHTLNYATIHAELSARFGADWRNDDIILTGGFPCQPYSAAGKRLGTADDRHLWPEMLRVISEVQPTWVVGENVRGLVNWSGGLVFEQVQADLEAIGYEVIPIILPACAVNAPHRRDRVWFIAHANSCRYRGCAKQGRSDQYKEWTLYKNIGQHGYSVWSKVERCCEITTDPASDGCDEQSAQEDNGIGKDHLQSGSQRISSAEGLSDERTTTDTSSIRSSRKKYWKKEPRFNSQKNTGGWWSDFPTQSPVCSRNDGLSYRLDGITFSKWRNESIKAYGNAVVPQVVYQIFKAIQNTKHP